VCGERVACAIGMRRAAMTLAIVLVLAPDASAQGLAGQPPRFANPQGELGAQTTFDSAYLLARYMTELAAAGAAPSQADIDEAARQYFTNGAEAMGVPSRGPGAAYFQNGAEVTGVPSTGPGAAYFRNGAEVMAYPVSRPARAPQETLRSSAATVSSVGSSQSDASTPALGSKPAEVDSGGAPDAANSDDAGYNADGNGPLPTSESKAGMRAAGAACPPSEIEAAMAIASQFAKNSAPPALVSWTPSAAEPTPPITPFCPAPTVPVCTPRPSLWSRLGPGLGGVFLGGLAVALWTRPRPVRTVQRGPRGPRD